MKAKNMIVGAALVTASFTTQAEFFTGNKLYAYMLSDNSAERSMAIGFVTGMHDAIEGDVHCSGAEVTTGQIRDVVKKYLEKNPSIRDMGSSLLVSMALAEAFPCAKKKKSKTQL